ncbi:MAG: hypothetical protein Fur0041_08850 [Bacteroidia bacterium]
MRTLIILLASIVSLQLSSRTTTPMDPALGEQRYGFSFAMSGVYSFFKTDTRHADPAKPRFGMGGALRIHLHPSRFAQIQIGLEVLSQSCRFDTYYFKTGYSSIFYDRNFAYTHKLRTYELYLPVLLRFNFNGMEANAPAMFYFIGGYAPKMFLAATTEVEDKATGRSIWGGSTELKFENWFIGNQTGNVIIAGLGFDKRFGWLEKFLSVELMYRYNFSRFWYYGNIDSNALLIKNSCITLQIGYRFQ